MKKLAKIFTLKILFIWSSYLFSEERKISIGDILLIQHTTKTPQKTVIEIEGDKKTLHITTVINEGEVKVDGDEKIEFKIQAITTGNVVVTISDNGKKVGHYNITVTEEEPKSTSASAAKTPAQDSLLVIADDVGFEPPRPSVRGLAHNTVSLWKRLALSKNLLPPGILVLEFVESAYEFPDGTILPSSSKKLHKKIQQLSESESDALKVFPRVLGSIGNKKEDLEEAFQGLTKALEPTIKVVGGDERRGLGAKRVGYWEQLPDKEEVREYFDVPENLTLIIVVGNAHAEEIKKRWDLKGNEYIESANAFLRKDR